jgi:membrane fusion protein (multidrug efflux system)
MKLFTSSVLGIAIAGAAFAAFSPIASGRLVASWRPTSTDNAYVHGDITPISPKISGYIVEAAVRDNQTVKAGEVLFRIDDTDYRARVNQAEASVAARRAMLVNLTSRIELQHAVIGQALAALQAADADATRAKNDFNRVKPLTARGFASYAMRDQAEADDLRSSAKVAEAKANVDAAYRQADVLKTERPELQADIDSAEAALALARIDLESTLIRSPADGRTGERQARLGQYVRPGTLLVPLVARNAWVVANFKETQIPQVHVGGDVSLSVDGVPGVSFRGKVESVSPASGAQFALLPPDNATGNFTRILQRVPVKITIDPAQPGFDDLRPGMSAIATIPSPVPSPIVESE